MTQEFIENSATIEDVVKVVLKDLVKTTQEKAVSYIKDNMTKVPVSDLLFVSGTFPDDYKCNFLLHNKPVYISLKQHVQYAWVSNRLCSLATCLDILHCVIIFEQTRNGNIHYHIIVHTKLHKHDLRAIICELFGFSKVRDIIINVNVRKVDCLDKLSQYLFNKKDTIKQYEMVDMDKFRPMILI